MDRRAFLCAAGAAATALATAPVSRKLHAAAPAGLLQRTIPASGERLVAVGIGTARRYASAGDEATLAPLRAAVARFAELGGQMIDTAPSYGEAEAVTGQLVDGLDLRERLFLATKVSSTGKAAGLAQIEDSFRRLRTDRLDLVYVHNLQDTATQLASLRELKQAGRVRYLGATTSRQAQHAHMAALIASEQLDLVQIDYAIDNRAAADRVLPLAAERGTGIVVNLPFGRGRLFEATRGRPLPAFAADYDIASWAQFFLKYVLSHPAVTCVIPGMAKVAYVDDNLAAARGRVPDAAARRRMEQVIDAL